MFSKEASFWRDRIQASGVHLGLSLGVAVLAALLVFGIWYPYPYREISGGRELFLLVVTVDVILGPLITLAIFNRSKAWPVLKRDLAVVAALQFGALAYGLWTVYIARPVHMVFEFDRFRVVHAIEVPDNLLDKAPAGVNPMPVTGPTLLSLRQFKDNNEKMDATVAALQGVSLSARPDLWQPYEQARPEILASARPVAALKQRLPTQAAAIDAFVASIGQTADSVVYVPMVGRKTFWTVFVDPKTAEVKGTMPLDSF